MLLSLSIVVGILGIIARQRAEVIVEWTTATEFNSVGFNLYRSENPVDQYIKINKDIIQSSPDPLTGGTYSYKDRDVQPGRTYYYQLEEIESSGATTRHGPLEVKSIAGGGYELILAFILFGVGTLGLLSTRGLQVNIDKRGTHNNGAASTSN